MLIRRAPDVASSEITSRELFDRRREFLRDAGLFAAAAGLAVAGVGSRRAHAQPKAFANAKKSPLSIADATTPYKDVTTYNNFYEFGTGKDDPAERAGGFKVRPWTLSVEGECSKPKRWDVDELTKLAAIEERIYQMRCVEGWSMVIP